MVEHSEIRANDALELAAMPPPFQRAAYSDRTAWQMAVFAELAYLCFEPPTNADIFKELIGEITALSGKQDSDSAEKLLTRITELLQEDGKGEKDLLRDILALMQFELVDTFYNKTLDPLQSTEGYVAYRHQGDAMDRAVLVFRGTTNAQDWYTNIKLAPHPLGGERSMHKGFYEAYQAVSGQVNALLDKVPGEKPLFIAGHSLGGALAVVATWLFDMDKLAACYTFGAPRTVNDVLAERGFRTPIYRIVNAYDPVPYVPPAGIVLDGLKAFFRFISKIADIWLFSWLVKLLIRAQKFRHVGDLRYFGEATMKEDRRYPRTMVFSTNRSQWERLLGFIARIREGTVKNPVTYHNMTTYRRKCRSRALDQMEARSKKLP